MTEWSRSGPSGCDEPITAGDTVIWMSGINPGGQRFRGVANVRDRGPGLVVLAAERRPDREGFVL